MIRAMSINATIRSPLFFLPDEGGATTGADRATGGGVGGTGVVVGTSVVGGVTGTVGTD